MSILEKWLDESEENRRLYAEERLIAEATEEIWAAMERGDIKTKAKLATKLGRSKAYVSQILDGSRNMTLRTLAHIGHVLGAKVDIRFEPKDTSSGWTHMNAYVVSRTIVQPAPEHNIDAVWSRVPVVRATESHRDDCAGSC